MPPPPSPAPHTHTSTHTHTHFRVYLFASCLPRCLRERGACELAGCGLAAETGEYMHVLMDEGNTEMLYPGCPCALIAICRIIEMARHATGGCRRATEAEVSAMFGGEFGLRTWLRDNLGTELTELTELVGCCRDGQDLLSALPPPAPLPVSSPLCAIRAHGCLGAGRCRMSGKAAIGRHGRAGTGGLLARRWLHSLPPPDNAANTHCMPSHRHTHTSPLGWLLTADRRFLSGRWQVASHIAVTLQSQFVNNMTVYRGVSPDRITSYYEVATKFWSGYRGNGINMNRFGGNLAAETLAYVLHGAGRAAVAAKAGLTGPPPKLMWFMGHGVPAELRTSTGPLPPLPPPLPPLLPRPLPDVGLH